MEIRTVSTVMILSSISFVWPLPLCGAFDIEGKISLSPPWPEPTQLEVTKDAKHCGPTQTSQTLLVSKQGGVQNAVVSLEGEPDVWIERTSEDVALEKAELKSRTLLNQINCHFEPHILIVPVNHPFRVSNSDAVVHDVRAFDGPKMIFRFEVDPGQSPVEQVFDRPGRFVIRCGFHPWMHSFVIAADDPYRYAVSDGEGRFKLANVPQGQYKLRIWHESLGEVEIPLEELKASIKDFSYTFPAMP